MRIIAGIFLIAFFHSLVTHAEDGYRLWLRYDKVDDPQKIASYRKLIKRCVVEGNSTIIETVRKELQTGLVGLLGMPVTFGHSVNNGALIVGTSGNALIAPLLSEAKLGSLGREGFLILSTTLNRKKVTVITANEEIGLLYGVFHFLRLMQTQQDISNLSIQSTPRIQLRLLNHWDNLDRTVERGYAGFSLWDWQRLPEYIDPRYHDYARANASIGINGTVLTNVNANALILSPDYLIKVQALATVFRPYGIKVFLPARFSAPIELGNLKTADPLDEQVKKWWKDKAAEIYQLIPDFGGFIVKANSEGQPGPQNYHRTHAAGANMLADALAPFNGVVMWRAFVYSTDVHEDRAKQAFNEFKPLDGAFRKNVLVQVKNGPVDFQPREPFHPLFGSMPKTPLMIEFQMTQEYLGFAAHLVYLGSLFKETLDADSYSKGINSTVARVVDGSLDHQTISGIAGVANTGTDRNWCGHPFAQANWYVLGRLAWDHQLTADALAEEWIRMTFTNRIQAVSKIKSIMMASREAAVNYMTPLGLHHIMGWNHHFGPGPWIKNKPRAEWTSVYYHQADTLGIGFNRTSTGSNALEQYSPDVQKLFESLKTCPEEYLLWFHHVEWNHRMKSGEPLWNELCYKYYKGVDAVREMRNTWGSLKEEIDGDRFRQVQMLLSIQEKEAVMWRNACVLYFQTFSRQPIPVDLEKPAESLEYYMKLEYPYAPGIRPTW